MGVRAYVIRLSQISSFFSYCHDKYATLADVVKHCVENLTNHVLRYRKLLMDDKSGMMKYQTGSHDDIISFILNGRRKVHMFRMIRCLLVMPTLKEKKLNTQVKERQRRNIVFVSPEKQITQNATHKIMRVPIRKVANLRIRKHLKVTRETSEV